MNAAPVSGSDKAAVSNRCAIDIMEVYRK